MLRAQLLAGYVRRRRWEARLMAAELGRAFLGGASAGANSGQQRAADGTPMVAPDAFLARVRQI